MPFTSPATRRLVGVVAALAALSVVGCALNGLPRIDPSGERFLLFPSDPGYAANQTAPGTMAPGQVAPGPVVAGPVVAPPTTPGTITPLPGNYEAPPVYGTETSRGLLDELLHGPDPVGPPTAGSAAPAAPRDHVVLTPKRVLAPVGAEVVVRAGVCADSGYLLTNERIEWILGQEGVGEFVTIGDRGRLDMLRSPANTPRKINNNYAIGSTSPVHECIDRGTPETTDDLQIRPGDAWITVSSATEGTSYVTAYAPRVESWNDRRASTTIYWIDAEWRLPPPATVPLGQPHDLVTTVTRQTDGAPIAGYLVRYDLIDSAGAQLGYGGGRSAEVVTDSAGRAGISITAGGPQPTSATVRVTIIRPERAGVASSPRLDIGSGLTTITWAPGVVPVPTLPPDDGFRPPQPTEPSPSDPIYVPPADTTAPPVGPPAPAVKPDLRVRIEQVTEAPVRIGQIVAFKIFIENLGDGPARNINLKDVFDVGLVYEGTAPGVQEILPPPGAVTDLGPKEQTYLEVEFRVRAEGSLCQTVTVTADGAEPASGNACVQVLPEERPEPPQLSVRSAGEPQRTVGDTYNYVLVVENAGPSDAANVRVEVLFPNSLRAMQATHSPDQPEFGRLVWTIPRIPASEQLRLEVEFEALAPAYPASINALVQAADLPQEEVAARTVEIIPPAGDSTATPGGGAPSPLQLVIRPFQDPAQVGTPSTLSVTLRNTSAEPMTNVIIQLALPPELGPRLNSVQRKYELLGQNVIQFDPIPELPAGEMVEILIPHTPTQQGVINISGRVRASSMANPTTANMTITVRPR